MQDLVKEDDQARPVEQTAPDAAAVVAELKGLEFFSPLLEHHDPDLVASVTVPRAALLAPWEIEQYARGELRVEFHHDSEVERAALDDMVRRLKEFVADARADGITDEKQIHKMWIEQERFDERLRTFFYNTAKIKDRSLNDDIRDLVELPDEEVESLEGFLASMAVGRAALLTVPAASALTRYHLECVVRGELWIKFEPDNEAERRALIEAVHRLLLSTNDAYRAAVQSCRQDARLGGDRDDHQDL